MKLLIQSTRRDGVMRKGEWRGLTRRGNGPIITSVIVCCPGCGKISTLTDHTIDPDGSVYPSLVCPFDICEFHEYVKLADWKPGE